MIGTRTRVRAGAARSSPGPRSPALHPRIRDRRNAVVRARGRRRLRALTVVAAVGVLFAVAVALLYFSGLASARHLTVTGSVHTPAAVVIAAAGVGADPPLIEVDTAAAATAVERLPWVARATVTRHWPDSLAIAVVERTPVAAMVDGHDAALVDGSGRVLAVEPVAPAGLPTLSAPVFVGTPGSQLADPVRPGLAVAAAVPPALAGRVVGVEVAAGGTVTLDLGRGVDAEIGPASSLVAKFEALASLLAGAPPTGPELIDLTVPDQPTVGPPAPAPAPAGPTP